MSDFAKKIAEANWDRPEFWRARGIGSNGGWKSLVTGEHVEFGPDVAGFVGSRESGERLVEHLEGRAKLDFRPSEPNWVQVKLIVEEEHKPVLQRLCDAVAACEGVIRPRILAWALDPENFPGYEPRMLKMLRSARELSKHTKTLLTIAESDAAFQGAHPMRDAAIFHTKQSLESFDRA